VVLLSLASGVAGLVLLLGTRRLVLPMILPRGQCVVISTHVALWLEPFVTDLVPNRLIQSFLGLLSNSSTGLFCAYLRSQGTWSRLLILGYLLGFPRKEEALPSTKPFIEYTLTCLDYCCLPAVLASLAYLLDFFSKPKTRFSGKQSRSLKFTRFTRKRPSVN